MNSTELNYRDKKYINKKIYEAAGAEDLIIKMIKLLSKSVENKDKKSEQVVTVEKMCLTVAKNIDIKEDEDVSLAETIYKYAIGSGYLRVENGRVSLTQKSKRILGLKV